MPPPASPADPPDGPLLTAFRREARRGPEVVAYPADEGPVVQAVGQLRSGRRVAWLGPAVDTTDQFLAAIGHRFGAEARARVHSELGLQPAPGRPLASRLVEPALAIARRTQGTLAGIDFVTRLAFSAGLGGSLFLACCREAGIDPAQLDGRRRAAIDAAMAQRFAAAADLPGGTVPESTAAKWLLELLAGHGPGAP